MINARMEAGNASIGLLRPRACEVRDTECLKLKLWQTSLPEEESISTHKLNLCKRRRAEKRINFGVADEPTGNTKSKLSGLL